MIMEYFSALLPLVLTASLQTTAPAASSATPQSQSCPVTIQSNLKFTNASAQPITAIIFHAAGLNAVGEELGPDPEQMKVAAAFNINPDTQSEQTYKKTLQPGQQGHASNNMGIYGYRMIASRRIYVRAVKFADGTIWKDNGSHSCKKDDGK
jgi:hypothetical protein